MNESYPRNNGLSWRINGLGGRIHFALATFFRPSGESGLTLLLLLTALIAAPGSVEASTYVSGRVDAADPGGKIAGVTVSLYPVGKTQAPGGVPSNQDIQPLDTASALTNGSFTVRAPHAGKYRLAARAKGYFTLFRELAVPIGGIADLRLSLRKPHPLRVRLVAVGGGLAAGGQAETWLWLIGDGYNAWYFARVGNVGADGLVDLPFPSTILLERFEGIEKIRVEARCERGCGFVDLHEWSPREIDLHITPGFSAAGVVVDTAGKPAAHSSVIAERLLCPGVPLPDPGIMAVTSDDNGRFSLPALFPETYRLHSMLPDGEQFVRSCTPSKHDEQVLVIGGRDQPYQYPHFGIEDGQLPWVPAARRLEPVAARAMPDVSGQVMDAETGKPVGEADTWLWKGERWESMMDSSLLDSRGAFMMHAPGPGTYRLGVQSDDHFRSYTMLTVPIAAGPITIRLHLLPRMVLTVVAADGMPITEKRIEYALAVGSRQGQFGNENSVAVDHGGKVTLLPPAWMTANGPADLSHIVLSLRSETSGCVQTRFEKWPFEPVRMQLAPGLSLHGRVLQFDGTPARFADVQFYPADVTDSQVCRTNLQADADGRFDLPHLVAGKYQGFFAAEGSNARNEVTLPVPDKYEMTIVLPKPPPNVMGGEGIIGVGIR